MDHANTQTPHKANSEHEAPLNLMACLDGDARAWQRFMQRYERHLRTAVRLTLAKGGPARATESEVDDVVQDIFVRLVRGSYRLLATYDPTRSTLATWLNVVARSAAVDHLRNKATARQLPLDEYEELVAAEEVLEETLDLPTDILSPRQRQVIQLAVSWDMDAVEIARVMDIHPQTVRSLKHNAVARLREHYAAHNVVAARGPKRARVIN